MHIIWSGPLVIALALYFLWDILGVAGMLFKILIQIPITYFSIVFNSYRWIGGDVIIASIKWFCCHQTEALSSQANDEKRRKS